MDKENFINKWASVYNVNDTTNPYFIADLEAVIKREIEMATQQTTAMQPENLKGNCSTFDGSRLVDQEQPALNPIAEAYERGEKIRKKRWAIREWVKKFDEIHWKSEDGVIALSTFFSDDFKTYPNKWEIYQEQPAKQFDNERFERMFLAVVANGDVESSMFFECTKSLIRQLDAFYINQEKGGTNG